jgi:hypothetical protein
MSSGPYRVISNAFESAGDLWLGSSKEELENSDGRLSLSYLWLDSIAEGFTFELPPSFIVSASLEVGGLTGGETTTSL